MKSITLALLLASLATASGQSTTIYFSGAGETWQFNYGGVAPPAPTGNVPVEFIVNGAIDSVSVQPFFITFDAEGNLLPDQVAFAFFAHYSGYPLGDFYRTAYQEYDPVTFYSPWGTSEDGISSSVSIAISGESPYSPAPLVESDLNAYVSQHPEQPMTFQFGFQVLSLTYTAVPEPGTVVQMVMGAVALVIWSKHKAWQDTNLY